MVSRHARGILGFVLSGMAGCGLLVGCGRGSNLSPVTGSVSHNGNPVTEGELTFAPIVGDGPTTAVPASATIGSDGKFAAKSGEDDGVSVGKHRLSYSAPSSGDRPEWDGSGDPPQETKSAFSGLVPSVSEVEIAAGNNDLKIELIAPPPVVQQ